EWVAPRTSSRIASDDIPWGSLPTSAEPNSRIAPGTDNTQRYFAIMPRAYKARPGSRSPGQGSHDLLRPLENPLAAGDRAPAGTTADDREERCLQAPPRERRTEPERLGEPPSRQQRQVFGAVPAKADFLDQQRRRAQQLPAEQSDQEERHQVGP